MPRTAPGTIFPAIAASNDPAFTLVTSTLVTALIVADGRVTGAWLRRIVDGVESEILARDRGRVRRRVAYSATAVRSGIRPEALGRYLNEHAFITSRVLIDSTASASALTTCPCRARGEFSTDSLWLP